MTQYTAHALYNATVATVARLETENARLRAENASLRAQLATLRADLAAALGGLVASALPDALADDELAEAPYEYSTGSLTVYTSPKRERLIIANDIPRDTDAALRRVAARDLPY